jgi:hypothetical protein
VGELAVEMRLGRNRPTAHPPGAVVKLGAEEKIDAPPVSRIAGFDAARLMEGHEVQAGHPGVAFQVCQRGPPAVASLSREDGVSERRDGMGLRAGPTQS